MGLVNSIYPIDYFGLAGVKDIEFPDNFWWASKERFAVVDDDEQYLRTRNGGSPTAEILEIDLGRVREVNYINFDVLRTPLSITIEYDLMSSNNRTPTWVPVKRLGTMAFDDRILYDAMNRSPWFNAQFYLTDPEGNIVHARYLRITFTRRDDTWPTTDSGHFRWSVLVKHMRIGHYISEIADATGPLLNQDIVSDPTPLIVPIESGVMTREVRQQFVYPESSVRDGNLPHIVGFGILVEIEPQLVDEEGDAPNDLSPAFQWSIWDVTGIPALLKQGQKFTAPVTGGTAWLDVYLASDQVITGSLDAIYELRVRSLESDICDTAYTTTPAILSSRSIPGTLAFVNPSTNVATSVDTRSVVKAGQQIINNNEPGHPYTVASVSSSAITLVNPYTGSPNAVAAGSVIYPMATWDGSAYTYDATKQFIVRVWADVGSSGQDVLGNSYRYSVTIDDPANVLDANKPGWMSAPMPSPDAVEALYFDVRTRDGDNILLCQQIDAIRIAPRTTGVQMNVYCTTQGLLGDAPASTEEWDMLLWTPAIHDPLILHKRQLIELPVPLFAAFIKLEFTSLAPMPFRVPTFPVLPPRQYRTFPAWIQDHFWPAAARHLVEDWFMRNASPHEIKVLTHITGTPAEFNYERKAFLAALALGQISTDTINQLINIVTDDIIHPTTAAQITVPMPTDFQQPAIAVANQQTALGQAVALRQRPNLTPRPNEKPLNKRSRTPIVSTKNDRVSHAHQMKGRIKQRFLYISRHVYALQEAQFNKKAYFVGIDRVEFLRKDYTTTRDETLILENGFDDNMLELNTFARAETTTIPDGAAVYVSYHTGADNEVLNEVVMLSGFVGVPLAVRGLARDVRVFDGPNSQGISYLQSYDYELYYGTDSAGYRVTYIVRSANAPRLAVPARPLDRADAGVLVAHVHIPSAPTEDTGFIRVLVNVSGENIPDVPSYGWGLYGGTSGTYGAMAAIIDDTGSITIHANISGADTYN